MIDDKEKNFISAVLYVRNNAEQVKKFLPALYSVLDSNFETFEVICVNDASSDGSVREIEEFAEKCTSAISIVNMSSFHGRELAMDAGVDLAIGDFVYEFDSLSRDYDMQLVVELYQTAVTKGIDIMSAVPCRMSGHSSKFFYMVFNKYSHSKNKIQPETFRILSRRAINRVKSLNISLVYRKAAYANCGLAIGSVPYQNIPQKRKLTGEEQNNREETAMDALILFTNVVQNLSFYISVLFLLMTVAIGIYTWVVYFSARQPVEGWAPLMFFLSMSFFGIFLILTVILQYLSVVLRMIFSKRQYLIESIQRLTGN